MPRSAAFTSGVLQELLRQLEYAPAGTHLRQMDAAEALLDVIEPTRLYPEDFITFRITGYRSDRPGPRTSVVGAALQRDLVTFIQCLSWDLDLPRTLDRGRAEDMDDLARRLGVSRRTLQRCRQAGLVLHFVRGEDGQRRLACYPDSLERFMASNPGRITVAASFSRLTDVQRAGIIEEAVRLGRDESVTLNEAARRIAVETGRSHEAVRGILKRNERTQQLFAEHGPLTLRDARVIERARGRGMDIGVLADRYGKSVSAVHRALHRLRLDRLLALPLVWRQEADLQEHRMPASVRHGLPHHALIDEDRLLADDAALDVALLRMDCSTHAMLCSEAAKGLVVSGSMPSVEQLDAVETMLRHAAMLHLRMMMQGFVHLRQRVEEFVQQPVAELPTQERAVLLRLLVDLLDRAILDADVEAGEGIVPAALQQLDAELEDGRISARPRRAASRSAPAQGGLGVLLRRRVPWAWLLPDRSDIEAASAGDATVRSLFDERFGMRGDAPCTLAELSVRHGTTSSAIERRLRRPRRTDGAESPDRSKDDT
tara:strand:- start:40287 stop:41915 length:1629 start_codon:yes stop_codon:yes gene_type:complete